MTARQELPRLYWPKKKRPRGGCFTNGCFRLEGHPGEHATDQEEARSRDLGVDWFWTTRLHNLSWTMNRAKAEYERHQANWERAVAKAKRIAAERRFFEKANADWNEHIERVRPEISRLARNSVPPVA